MNGGVGFFLVLDPGYKNGSWNIEGKDRVQTLFSGKNHDINFRLERDLLLPETGIQLTNVFASSKKQNMTS